MFKKFFSSDSGKKKKSTSIDDSDVGSSERRKKLQRSTTIAAPEASRAGIGEGDITAEKKKGNNGGARPKQRSKQESTRAAGKKKKKKNKDSSNIHVDVSQPLEWPCTPEHVLEYHKQKPFLSNNEEWLIVELNEFECLVESMDIIKVIAKHSKFFEIDPDELWEEFFEFMEDAPTYDEIINYDVWQEFRDKKYPC